MANPQIKSPWRIRIQLFLFTLLLTGGVGFILSSELLLTRSVSIQKGQAASEDIAAPSRIEFESEILTEAERRRKLAEVKEVYDPLDRQVGREQVNLALRILDFVDSVRADPYASPMYQRRWLEGIESVKLSPQVISDTLQLSETEWKDVQLETRRVLAQVMREEIKTGQEDFYRRSVRVLIAFELNESQTAVVNEIASALVKANRVYNAQATESARQAALEGVQPQMRVLEENEIVVRSGEIVSAEDIEALEALGLLNPQIDWLTASGAFLFVFSLAVFMSIYMRYNEPVLQASPHRLLLFSLLLILYTLLAKWELSQSVLSVYLSPLASLGMLMTVLFNVRVGLVAHVFICLVVGYITGPPLDLFLYSLSGGLMGILALRRVNRINTFVWAGVYVMFANIVVALPFALLKGELETLQLARSVLVGIVNGGLSAILSLGGSYLLGVVFDITTPLQLLDLARPTHPLMRQLLLNASGTYHHSIMVGNMAEQAAEAIGADALLARVGAFYHDIGKTVRPYFFIENQMGGSNPHDSLDPETSSEIIFSHASDGLVLARKHRLPRAIRAFIAEHHGTSKLAYFYHRACQEYGKENVDVDKYRYPGPRPQSKETAIVMMADSCEAAVRSARPQDRESLEHMARKIVFSKVSSGQLDDAPLTLKEIETITASFMGTLQGQFHLRVSYPSDEQPAVPSVQSEPVPAAVGEGPETRELAVAEKGVVLKAAMGVQEEGTQEAGMPEMAAQDTAAAQNTAGQETDGLGVGMQEVNVQQGALQTVGEKEMVVSTVEGEEEREPDHGYSSVGSPRV